MCAMANAPNDASQLPEHAGVSCTLAPNKRALAEVHIRQEPVFWLRDATQPLLQQESLWPRLLHCVVVSHAAFGFRQRVSFASIPTDLASSVVLVVLDAQ